MLVYMVYDKRNGKVVHMHRAVDVAGRSTACTDEEVLAVLPPNVDPKTVGVVPADLERMPSGRETTFAVDMAKGALIQTPVARTPAKQEKKEDK